MKTNQYETIVVGGGMAGMACAIKLKEAGNKVLMITETLGGRTCYDPQLQMNFGAVFYMENYHHVKNIIGHGPRLLRSYSQVMCHKSPTDHFSAFSFQMLAILPQLLKFRRFMKKFVNHYEAYKQNCETMSIREAMEKDSFIKELYFQSAHSLIQRLKVDKACENLVSQFVYGCTGTTVHGLNALDFCNCAQGLIMPIYTFTFDKAAVGRRIGNVICDSVIGIEKRDESFAVTTEKGMTATAKNLVVATPAVVTQKLLRLPTIRQSSQLIAYLVRGVPKQKFRKHDLHIFADTIPLIFFYHRQNDRNEYEVFSVNELELDAYFDSYHIVGQKKWPNALYVKGDIILDQDLGDGLYIAGDHNGLGMEPAAVSGIFAANRILGNT